ncbi:protein ninH [Salmonella enterica]|uniref:Protein ninH n=13 Tax=Enterobacteriaceae TaxID=543 RepID=A0A5I9C8Q9_SALET|nr:phage NinH family protein [Salmonella enterica]EAA3558764.1 protein ninH [Salmonella enterica subsp. enterica serovar Montevideo]EAB7296385.1 protein ninH [Salmonella enterica subsp. enterica serovar Panama]EAB9411482.1 protein ninH [Salmonella enterica subsp. enterica serovar Schwarzengrund]EBE3425360.1 protein ninH [Salmonella enterica subsp. enterica serovar Meleagridis]EBI0046629.1 protein ninH [Salmonella enterica subsp. enterica serovar Braenderup]EBI0272068.1 protein ninH [Salmonell
MTPSIKTIPELLIETYGNQTEVARRLSCHRNTVRRYLYDKEARYHAIVNGVLMIHQGGRGVYDRNQH